MTHYSASTLEIVEDSKDTHYSGGGVKRVSNLAPGAPQLELGVTGLITKRL